MINLKDIEITKFDEPQTIFTINIENEIMRLDWEELLGHKIKSNQLVITKNFYINNLDKIHKLLYEDRMTNWKYTIDLTDFYHEDNIDLKTKATLITKKFKFIKPMYPDDNILISIMEDFKTIKNEGDFNSTMTDLYDWADHNLVWINTI